MSTTKPDVLALLPEIKRIVDRIPADFGGGLSPLSKVLLMSHIVLEYNLKNYVEIGVYKGRSFFPLAYTVQISDGMSYGIDPYDLEAAKEYDLDEDFGKQVNEFLEKVDFLQIYEDVKRLRHELGLTENSEIIKDKSSTAVNYFPKNKIAIGMLHIDGNHDTKQVLKDVELYVPLVHPGGFVVMDDVNWDSVKHAFDQLKEKHEVVFNNGYFAILFIGNASHQIGSREKRILNVLHGLFEKLEEQQIVTSLGEEMHRKEQLMQALRIQIAEKEKNSNEHNTTASLIYSFNSLKFSPRFQDVKRLIAKSLISVRSFILKICRLFFYMLPIPEKSKKKLRENLLYRFEGVHLPFSNRLTQLAGKLASQDSKEISPPIFINTRQGNYEKRQERTLLTKPIIPNYRNKISVIVTSYDHEKYIRQCLDSILMQKGHFDLEVILGDDSSTDKTRDIMQQYYKMHPEIMKMMPIEVNLGITKNLKRCLDACSGDYIAICEGDDFWIDENKLQKQLDFLQSHKDYSMCFSAIILLWEDENKLAPFSAQSNLTKRTITIDDLIEFNYIGNFSCCMYTREAVKNLPQEIFNIFTVDWMFNMACGEVGKIGFIKDFMSVYRKHTKGVWAGKSDLEQIERMLPNVESYNELLHYRYNRQFMKYKEKLISLKRILQTDQETLLNEDVHIQGKS